MPGTVLNGPYGENGELDSHSPWLPRALGPAGEAELLRAPQEAMWDHGFERDTREVLGGPILGTLAGVSEGFLEQDMPELRYKGGVG